MNLSFTAQLHNSDFFMNFSPDYMTLFEFEKFEDFQIWRQWIDDNWRMGFFAAFLYILFLQIGANVMKYRHPLSHRFRRPILLWNVLLATFYIIGFCRMVPELVVNVKNSFRSSVCNLENHNAATALWGLLFCFAKILEFGDSVIRILRKKPLSCLHWYYRLTACIYCWSSHGSNDPTMRWFYTMSYLVNFFFHAYYAMRFKRQRRLVMVYVFAIFLLLLQVIIGFSIDVFTLSLEIRNFKCGRFMKNVFLALIVHASNFVVVLIHLFKICFYKKVKQD